MVHPYRTAGRAGAKSKFKAILGTTKGAKHMNDDSVVSGTAPVKNGIEDVKIMGQTPPRRLDRARGGKVAKKGVTVNVIVPPSTPPVPPLPIPSGPPPGLGAGPGGPPMPPRPPMMPPPGMGAGPGPGAGMPIPRARGGKVKHSDEAEDKKLIKKMIAETKHRADGGKIDLPVIRGAKLQRKLNKADPLSGLVPAEAINPDYVPGMPPPNAPKARGGYIGGEAKSNQLKQWAQYSRKNSYHKKSGGGITKAVLTGGADSGVGRLQHSKQQGKHLKGK